MTSAVPVQCTCGHTSTVEPTALGRPRLCEACGHSFVAWPLEKDIRQSAPPTWFVRVGAHELGPFHRAELDRLVTEGRVTATTLVRRQTGDPWITAGDAGLVDPAADPLPPPASPLPVAAPIAQPLPVAAPVVAAPVMGTGGRSSSRARRATPGTNKRSPLVAIGIATAIVVVGLGAWAALRSAGTTEGNRVATGDGTSDEAEHGGTARAAEGPTLDAQMTRLAASVVRVTGRHGAAAGFVVAPGIVATSRRLLADERLEDVRLESAPPAATSPRLRYIDPELDLAFLELDADVSPLALATKVSLAPGTQVNVLGYAPTSASAAGTPALTRGACRSRVLLAGQPHNLVEVPADSPCSGCPVLDGEGGVIGMVTCVPAAETGQCVFIPLSALKASLDRALALPDGEREHVVAMHRLGRLGRQLWAALRSYSDVGQTYLAAMQDAVAKGQDPGEGLDAVRTTAKARLQSIDKGLPADLDEQVATALDDPTLHNLTKRRMKRLQAAFDGLRAHLADPPTVLQDYRRRQEHWAYEANTAGRELLEADGLRLEGE